MLAGSLLLGGGCGQSTTVPAPRTASKRASVPLLLPFTVRGRWPRPMPIRYRFTQEPGPLSRPVFQATLRQAFKTWEAAAPVAFAPARGGKPAQVSIGWQSTDPEKGAGPGFMGARAALAETGPPAPGSFIRFNKNLPWRARGGSDQALFPAALHELGHLLGLGESPDQEAVMHVTHDSSRTRLQASDLLGIQSLYGGPPAAPGDLLIQSPGTSRFLPLRGLARASDLRLASLDTNGDGRAELFIWSRAVALGGALASLHFNGRGQLERTEGPFQALMPPRYRSFFDRSSRGRPLLVHLMRKGRYQAFFMNPAGLPARPLRPGQPLGLSSGFMDRQGDGCFEHQGQLPRDIPPIQGDLDGDGRPEVILEAPPR